MRLYIDDFGTGYSSLAYLRDLPGLRHQARPRVRRGAARARERSPDSSARSATSPRTLGLDYVVAEGIETAEQRDALIELGYTVGQGYYLARPTDAGRRSAHCSPTTQRVAVASDRGRAGLGRPSVLRAVDSRSA